LKHDLGIIVPSFNEAESIALLIGAIREAAPEARIVVVDDSPTSATVEAVNAKNDALTEIIHRSEKGGRGSAILVGMKRLLELGCCEIIEMDADFSHPPKQIPEIIAAARAAKYDLLIASRYLSESRIVNWPLSRRVFSKASNHLARLLLGVPINDYTNGYRYYSRAAAELIVATCGQYGKGFIALSEILVNVYYAKGKKLRVGEIPTVFVNRVRGESSVNRKEIASAFFGLFKIFGLKRRLVRG
jgi:dolichol-phosphate mannosyltransferase